MKLNRNGSIAACLLIFLTGCASHPDKIDASYVSTVKYQKYDCDQVAMEMDHTERKTNKLYQSLKAERTADNWQMGVGLVLFWPSLFLLEGGDGPEAGEYAQLKGNYDALRQTSVQKKCGISRPSLDVVLRDAEEADKEAAKKVVEESGAKYKDKVKKLANAMDCKEAVSLQDVTAESEKWELMCGDGRSLTVRCFDGDCYVRQLDT